MLPVIPIYYGGELLLNITKLPSFIHVAQFNTPKDLAYYLLYLDANPTEYEKYHLWRTETQPFTSEYLELLQNRVPGPAEVSAHIKHDHHPKGVNPDENTWLKMRTASCCRLCNEEYVKRAKIWRSDKDLVSRSQTKAQIMKLVMKSENGKIKTGKIT